MKMLYEVLRPDGSWVRMTRARALTAAAGKLIKGRGRFTIVAPFRRPTSDEAPSLRRREALDTIGKTFNEMRPDETLSVRDARHEVILRVRAVPAIDPRRTSMAHWARWGVSHSARIHYSQARPFPLYAKGRLPLTLDCSSSTITYAHWAGAPDPGGFGFSGAGNTDSMLRHLKERKSVRDAELGDPIVWANGSDGKHVAVVIEPGRDPLLASHGSEDGPIQIRFSAEDRWHAAETPHVLDLLS